MRWRPKVILIKHQNTPDAQNNKGFNDKEINYSLKIRRWFTISRSFTCL